MPRTTIAENAYPRLQVALEALTDWINRAAASRAADREFVNLAPGDLEGMARDLGISVYDLRAVAAKGRSAASLLFERLAALHLNPARIAQDHPAVMQDLERLCTLCEAQRRCRHDMQHDRDDPVWQTYCPNTDTLRALRGEYSKIG